MTGNVTVVDHPLIQHKLTLMRQKETPSALFRQLLREITLLLTYEITRDMALTSTRIETMLEPMEAPVLAGPNPAVISILRAGNGMLDGALEVLPQARVGFVGLYRDEATLKPVKYYFKVPDRLEERLVILVDPMLATGNSSAAAAEMLKQAGARDIRFLCLLAAPEGVDTMSRTHPDVQIVTAAIDRQLNAQGYILPGLGDAGDRIFGTL